MRTLHLQVIPALDTVQVALVACDSSAAGEFLVVLTSQFGCDSVVITTVAYFPLELEIEIIPATIGMNDGTATVFPSGGQGPYTVLWSTGDTGNTVTGLAAGTYSLSLTDASGCEEEVVFEVPQASSLKNISSLSSFEAFPNPATDQLRLQLQFARVERGILMLQDKLGRAVYRSPFEGSEYNTDISIKHLLSGVYHLRVVVGKQEEVKQIVIHSN